MNLVYGELHVKLLTRGTAREPGPRVMCENPGHEDKHERRMCCTAKV